MKRFQNQNQLRKFTPQDVLAFAKGMERVLADLSDYAEQRDTIEVPFSFHCQNLLALGCPAAGPLVVGGGSPVSGGVEFATAYASSVSRRQTNLSPATAADEDSSYNLQGPRSLDPSMDLVRIFQRPQGSSDKDWLLWDEIPNPTSGQWDVTGSSNLEDLIADPEYPLDLRWPLWTVCGDGWFIRRVKIRWWGGEYQQSTSNYWVFQLARQVDGSPNLGKIATPQTTQGVILSPDRVYSIPQPLMVPGQSSPVLDVPIAENDTIWLTARGVGSLNPLPNFMVTVSVVRRVP